MLTKAISCFHIMQMAIYSGTTGFLEDKNGARKVAIICQIILNSNRGTFYKGGWSTFIALLEYTLS